MVIVSRLTTECHKLILRPKTTFKSFFVGHPVWDFKGLLNQRSIVNLLETGIPKMSLHFSATFVRSLYCLFSYIPDSLLIQTSLLEKC